MATAAQTIKDPTPDVAGGLLTALLGQNQSGRTDTATQQLIQALTQGTQTGAQTGTQTGTTGASTINTAQLGPLLQAFATSSQGMTPESMQALITSIFTEGARAVPELTGQFANSTGSRVQGNSGLNLALGDLNRQLSTQAAQAILQNNQQSQSTAAQIAANIAANTRETQQTGTTQQATAANTTQANTENRAQTQTGTTNTTQQQQTGVDPSRAALLGLGGTALNFLDKKGMFDGLFGRTATPTPGGVGTISGSGNLASAPAGGVTLANPGGGSAGFLSSAPAASQGTLALPAPAQPAFSAPTQMVAPAASAGMGFNLGVGGGGTGITDFTGGGFAPAAGGITGLGGFGDSAGGFLGTAANAGFGALPDTANYFGTLGTSSLGDNLSFGANPYGYQADGSGIMAAGTGGGSMFGDFGTSLGNFGSSIWGGAQDLFGGIGDWIGGLFADGGQIEVGANPTRIRNANYLGPRQRESQSEALNYDGYAPAAVGASTPAGGSPSLGVGTSGALGGGAGGIGLSAPSAMMAPMTAVAPAQPTQSAQFIDPNARAREMFFQQMLAQQAAAAAAQAAQTAAGGTGGSGGVGEGAAPGQNEADNGAAGIGPSGIAAAPQGTNSAIGMGSNAIAQMSTPAALAMAIISAMAAAVNAGNQPSAAQLAMNAAMGGGGPGAASVGVDGAVSSPVSQGNVQGTALGDIGATQGGGPGDGSGSATSGGVNADGSGGGGNGPGGPGPGNASAGDGGDGGGDYADGGLVSGIGTGISDSIKVRSKQPGGKMIRYSDGEYVIPKDVVDALGVHHFDSILDAFHTPASLQ